MAGQTRRVARKALTRLRGPRPVPGPAGPEPVPGLTPNPASNLVMADVAMRMGSYLLRRAMERGFLKGRFGRDTAKQIVKNRSLGQSLASIAIARFATSSLPGAAIVTTGMAVKVLLDRSKARHQAVAEGDTELLRQADGQ